MGDSLSEARKASALAPLELALCREEVIEVNLKSIGVGRVLHSDYSPVARSDIGSLFHIRRIKMLERQTPADQLIGQDVAGTDSNGIFSLGNKIQDLPVVS